MPRWPNRGSGRPMPLILSHWFDPDYINTQNAAPASVAWIAANEALYLPIWVTERILVTTLWWQNGATVTGNVDCGIYDDQGNRIVSTGSTAQTGTSTVQSVDITDTAVEEGLIYLALAASSASATFWQAGAGNDPGGHGYSGFVQTSAFPLPTPATFATAFSGSRMVKFGATRAPRTVI